MDQHWVRSLVRAVLVALLVALGALAAELLLVRAGLTTGVDTAAVSSAATAPTPTDDAAATEVRRAADGAALSLAVMVRRLAWSAVVLSLAWLACILIDLFFWRIIIERHTGLPAPRLGVAIVRVLVLLAAVGVIVGYVFQQSIDALVVSSGVVGVVLGFALQRMISDFFSGIAMSAEKPFTVGDWIEVEGEAGRVIETNWRATRLVRLDQVMVVVPNSFIGERKFLNYDRPNKYFRAELPVTLEHHVPVADAKRVLMAAIRATQGVLPTPEPDIIVTELGERGVRYMLRYYVRTYDLMNHITDGVATNVTKHLWQAGMSVPYPKRDVFHAPMPPRQIDERAEREALLARVDLFETLSEADRAELAAAMTRRTYQSGEIVVKQNETGASMFVLVQGLLEVRVQADGQTQRVAQLTPGQFFGERTLLTGEARMATVAASTEAIAYELSHESMRPILERHPAFARTLSEVLAQREHELADRAVGNGGTINRAARQESSAQMLRRIRNFFGLGHD